ncbi:MAG: hypothetical protein DRN66_03230, partial [Candidatus Nanohalarchaeota archaeon]
MKAGFEKVILVCLIFASFVAFSLSIDNFSCQQINTSAVSNITKEGTTSLYNFSVNTTGNFTAFNLTIPTAFTYIENSSNNTLYPNWTCSNCTAKIINCSCLSCNASVNGTSSIYVWFNATSPSYSNETWFNFSVFVWANETNNATKNATIGNDGNITFIGNVSGIANDTIVQNQNITIYSLVNDSFAGINLSKNNSVQVRLRDYNTGSINATYNMTYNGQNNFSATFDTGSLNDGAYNISIYAMDQVGNYNYSNTSYYFNVTPQPDLIIESVNWTSVCGGSYPFMRCNGSYTNFTINVTVKNNGTANIVNSTNITFKWDTTKYTKNENLNKTLLTAGGTQNFTYFILGSSANTSDGLHTIHVNLDTANQTEKNENNNAYSESLYIGYNVTILGLSPSSVVPGENLNITLKVLYGNGSAVDNLSSSSEFKIYDQWNSNGYTLTNGNITSINRTQNTSGIYNITYMVNSSIYGSSKKVAQYGTHDIRVGVIKGNYSRWINDTNNNYTINAPNLEIRFYGVDTTLTKDTEDEFYIQYRNTGNVEITNISIRAYTNNSNINIKESSSGSYGRGYTCSSSSSINLGSSTTYTNCPVLKLKGTSVGEFKLYFTYAYGAATSTGAKYNSTSLPSEIITVSAAPTDNDDNDN